ncbi:TetR/AcrR family transcriptional regulator [Paenibacillus sp. MMS20-IR301]|uniref:TetR/AcrR family transcriptional regulator n=1 Tax=Paenibacillus sp. MMS20-IR301 TaxID=2895946 RepID=UPI0028E79681|nr:TetR/AcrR family transcriptional regulator [Paenibacillus sp. MMS20-IR301]WNS41111.1 TetR/AcrR family transcriptional regulator [Paenibacillus sp. MMS20-IR301]
MQNASQLFAHKGYGAVSMNEVCAAAKVSKGSLYHHFPSKDELFLHVVEDDTQKWLCEWEELRSTISGTEARLYALGDHYANDFQNPIIHALEEYSRSRTLTEDISRRLSEVYESASQACREVLQEGMDSGYLAPGNLDKYVIIVSGMLEGICRVSEITALAQNSEDIREYYRGAIQMLLQGMRLQER